MYALVDDDAVEIGSNVDLTVPLFEWEAENKLRTM